MKVLIVGGGKGKESSIIYKLYELFSDHRDVKDVSAINGFDPIPPTNLEGQDLTLWLPDIDNEEPKDYPVKDQGAVLICSKVLHGDRARIDAVSRIFNMRGNAVVAITKHTPYLKCITCCHATQVPGSTGSFCGFGDNRDGVSCSADNQWNLFEAIEPEEEGITSIFKFELIDALNNTWCKTTDLSELVLKIAELYKWTKESRRVSLEKNDIPVGLFERLDYSDISAFIGINKELALKVADGCGNRFFGNYSTRCTKLFPSTRKGKDFFFFSPRNIDKKYVTTKDLVLTDHSYYYGDRKPSVDTPVQLALYSYYPNINYMIHGHAYIKNAHTTLEYYPCGDMREVAEVIKSIGMSGITRINLKNHGFLLLGENIADMQEHFEECEFFMIGEHNV